MRRLALAALAAALTFFALAAPSVAGGCLNTTKPVEGTSPDVRIDKCQFRAGILRVPVGTVVKWTNDDVFPHVISGIDWGRTQPMLSTGESWSHTFTEAGIYPYTCTLHPGMSKRPNRARPIRGSRRRCSAPSSSASRASALVVISGDDLRIAHRPRSASGP